MATSEKSSPGLATMASTRLLLLSLLLTISPLQAQAKTKPLPVPPKKLPLTQPNANVPPPPTTPLTPQPTTPVTPQPTAQALVKFDESRTEFQTSQVLTARSLQQFQVYEVRYTRGNSDTEIYLSRQNQLDSTKAHTYAAWAKMRRYHAVVAKGIAV